MCHLPLGIQLKAEAGHGHPVASLIYHEGLTVSKATGGDHFHESIRGADANMGRIRGGAHAGDSVGVDHSNLHGVQLHGLLRKALLVLPFY